MPLRGSCESIVTLHLSAALAVLIVQIQMRKGSRIAFAFLIELDILPDSPKTAYRTTGVLNLTVRKGCARGWVVSVGWQNLGKPIMLSKLNLVLLGSRDIPPEVKTTSNTFDDVISTSVETGALDSGTAVLRCVMVELFNSLFQGCGCIRNNYNKIITTE